jgi:hypothetical protein
LTRKETEKALRGQAVGDFTVDGVILGFGYRRRDGWVYMSCSLPMIMLVPFRFLLRCMSFERSDRKPLSHPLL